MSADKKKVIKSFDKLDDELQKQFTELYPQGYNDYKEKVFRLTNAKNENFFVAPMETNDTIYLVKVEMEQPKDEDEEDDDNYDDKEEQSSNQQEESYEDDHDLD